MGRKRLQQDNLILSTKLMMNEWLIAETSCLETATVTNLHYQLSYQLKTKSSSIPYVYNVME